MFFVKPHPVNLGVQSPRTRAPTHVMIGADGSRDSEPVKIYLMGKTL
jgi:hypothetical protein